MKWWNMLKCKILAWLEQFYPWPPYPPFSPAFSCLKKSNFQIHRSWLLPPHHTSILWVRMLKIAKLDMPLVLEWNVFGWSVSSCSSTASFASLKTICRNGSFKPFEVCHCTLLDILPVFMSITTVLVPKIISNTLSTASYAALKVIGSIAPSNPF